VVSSVRHRWCIFVKELTVVRTKMDVRKDLVFARDADPLLDEEGLFDLELDCF